MAGRPSPLWRDDDGRQRARRASGSRLRDEVGLIGIACDQALVRRPCFCPCCQASRDDDPTAAVPSRRVRHRHRPLQLHADTARLRLAAFPGAFLRQRLLKQFVATRAWIGGDNASAVANRIATRRKTGPVIGPAPLEFMNTSVSERTCRVVRLLCAACAARASLLSNRCQPTHR